MVRNLWLIWIMFFHIFICDIIRVKHSDFVFIILSCLFNSFLHIRSLRVPYACVSIELIDCILLSSFELQAIFLTSSIKTCISLLNLCFVFNICLFLMNSFMKTIYISFFSFLNILLYFQFEMLLDSYYNL